MLMFKRTFWRNHVEDQDGKVIQQGTLLEQDQFNRMEVGISDSNMAANIIRRSRNSMGEEPRVCWKRPATATTPTLPASRP